MFLQIRRFLVYMPLLKSFLRVILNLSRFIFFYIRVNRCKLEKGFSISKVGSASDLNFFGYYNKSPISRDGTNLLTHNLINEQCYISIASINKIEKIIPIVETTAFNFQQGSMLQWVNNEVFIFNDFIDETLMARIYDIHGNNVCNLVDPVEEVSHEGDFYLSIDFNSLTENKSEYGYSKLCPRLKLLNNKKKGIVYCDIKTKISRLVVSKQDLRDLNNNINIDYDEINHLMISPDDNSFIFIYRYYRQGKRESMLYHYNFQTRSIKLISSGIISHFCWFDSDNIFIWLNTAKNKGYCLFNIKKGSWTNILNISDGHPTMLNESTIVSDSYPSAFGEIHLYSIYGTKIENIAKISSKPNFNSDLRCDLHPRVFKDIISIDSNFSGKRSQYLIYKNAS